MSFVYAFGECELDETRCSLRRGGEEVRLVAVNVDPRESDLRTTSEAPLARAVSGIPFQYIQGVEGLAGGMGEARLEFWRLCLIAALTVLMGEQSLAWWWGRKR